MHFLNKINFIPRINFVRWKWSQKKNTHNFVSMLMFSELRWWRKQPPHTHTHTENEMWEQREEKALAGKWVLQSIGVFHRNSRENILSEPMYPIHVCTSKATFRLIVLQLICWIIFIFRICELSIVSFYVLLLYQMNTHSRTPIERTGKKSIWIPYKCYHFLLWLYFFLLSKFVQGNEKKNTVSY